MKLTIYLQTTHTLNIMEFWNHYTSEILSGSYFNGYVLTPQNKRDLHLLPIKIFSNIWVALPTVILFTYLVIHYYLVNYSLVVI